MAKTPPEPPESAGDEPAGQTTRARARAGGRPAKPAGAEPASTSTSTATDSGTPYAAQCHPYATGVTILTPAEPPIFEEIERLEGIDPANLRTTGDAYYEGMLERIGTFRAIDELVARFLGGLNINSSDVRSDLITYMKQEPLRVAREDREPVLSLFGDAMLESLLLRLSDAVIAFDLSAAPEDNALVPSAVPEAAARLAVIAVLEDLELFLDGKGGGGVSFITNEVGSELTEIVRILNNPGVRPHVPGNDVDDVFSVITGLLAGQKDVPTDWEARQLARKASLGRQIFLAIAGQIDGTLGTQTPQGSQSGLEDPIFSDADIATIGGLVYQWRAALPYMPIEGVDDAGANGQAADENRVQVVRLRRRA